MRVLVLGATGMLGHMACRVFSANHEVWGVYRAPRNPQLERYIPQVAQWISDCNAVDLHKIETTIGDIRPTVVFNCIGLVKQKESAANPVEAININALLPHQLAEICDSVGCKLIQFSTDCVFSGRRGMYNESDEPDALDLYGRTKLLGEVIAPHLTIRTSFFGRQLAGSEGLLEWFISRRGGRVKGYLNAIFSGLTTETLCELLDRALSRRADLSGIYHVASEPISKYDLLNRVNTRLRLGIRIDPDESFRCDRSLDGRHFRADTELEVPSWDTMLEQLESGAEDYAEWRSRFGR